MIELIYDRLGIISANIMITYLISSAALTIYHEIDSPSSGNVESAPSTDVSTDAHPFSSQVDLPLYNRYAALYRLPKPKFRCSGKKSRRYCNTIIGIILIISTYVPTYQSGSDAFTVKGSKSRHVLKW